MHEYLVSDKWPSSRAKYKILEHKIVVSSEDDHLVLETGVRVLNQ